MGGKFGAIRGLSGQDQWLMANAERKAGREQELGQRKRCCGDGGCEPSGTVERWAFVDGGRDRVVVFRKHSKGGRSWIGCTCCNNTPRQGC